MLRYLYITFLFVSCVSSRDGSNNSDEPLRGEWQLAAFPYSFVSFAEIFGQYKPSLQFLSAGRLKGTTGCNEVTGDYSISGDKMLFTRLVKRTAASCRYNEDLFVNALSQATHYRIEDSRMQLLKDTVTIMVFAKKL